MFAARGGFLYTQTGNVITVTGGTLSYSGSYSVRTFDPGTSSLGISGGNLSFDYLVVGHGGDGGSYTSGTQRGKGGGGGGEVLTGNITYTPSSYTVFVSTSGGNGQSILNDIVADPGVSVTGTDSASGTGGGSGNGTSGGNRFGSNAGGGGGADGDAGNNAPNSNTGGDGGTGTTSSITGTSIVYGSGGGGGADGGGNGGVGGDGAGDGASSSVSTPATSGTNGRGAGGGGAFDGFGSLATGGQGGHGTVIIRYLTAGTA